VVLAHGHERRVVEQDVGRLQDRVAQQARGHRLLPRRLVLELRHPLEVAQRSHGVEDPGELRVLGHLGLDEEGRPLGVDPCGEERERHVEDAGRHLGGVVRGRDRVQVHDADEALVVVLHLDPVPHRPEVVADVEFARRLDAAEDARPLPRHSRSVVGEIERTG
jgi:hypothetical protein